MFARFPLGSRRKGATMDNRYLGDRNNYQPEQSDLDLDAIVNEFKDYTPDQQEPQVQQTQRPQQTVQPQQYQQQTYRPQQTVQPQQYQQHARPVQQTAPAKSGGGKKILAALLSFLAVGVLVGGIYLGVKMLRGNQNPTEAPVTDAPVTDAPTEKTTDAPENNENTEEPTEEVTEAPETEVYVPDGDLLEAIENNPDVVARLTYGNDYSLYITKGSDNVYYLDHDYQKNSSWTGAPFMDYRNSLSPRDTNLMIHGHNMKNNTIFSNLINFYKEDFTRSYPIVKYETATDCEYYVIFAVTDVEVDPDTSTYFKITEWNFDTDEAYNNYVNYFIDHARQQLGVKVEPGDELLTLSTCNYIGVDGRLLICCRKLHDDETPESILEQLRLDNAA